MGVGFKCACVIKLNNRECSWMKMAEEDLRHWHNNLNLKNRSQGEKLLFINRTTQEELVK